jgi:aspartyl-tRNA(Asn)/glutamyl-tRNA(Gln) amidotransferase subunit A
MLWPTIPLTTVPLDDLYNFRHKDEEETPMQAYVHHTFSANITGQPALSVPCGFSEDGLPIGFQLLGQPFSETTLFRLAYAYEQAHSWYAFKPMLSI